MASHVPSCKGGVCLAPSDSVSGMKDEGDAADAGGAASRDTRNERSEVKTIRGRKLATAQGLEGSLPAREHMPLGRLAADEQDVLAVDPGHQTPTFGMIPKPSQRGHTWLFLWGSSVSGST